MLRPMKHQRARVVGTWSVLLALVTIACDAAAQGGLGDTSDALLVPTDVDLAMSEDTGASVEDWSVGEADTSVAEGDTSIGEAEPSFVDADTNVRSEDASDNSDNSEADLAVESWIAPNDGSIGPLPTVPTIVYTLGGARTLLFLNNPEQVISVDLGDATLGDTTLYRVTATGACRSFFEHVNRTGRTIGFGPSSRGSSTSMSRAAA